MSKRALIVIDLQNDYFPGGKFTLSGTDAAADNAAKLIAAFRAADNLVVHVRHESEPGDTFFARGSTGAETHPKVAPNGGEPVVVKTRINAFRDTDLKATLDRHGITDVVICGAMSHMCVDAATRAGSDFGYASTVIHDACASRDLDFNGVHVPAAHAHAAFMAALEFGYAKLASTAAFLDPNAKAA